MEWIRSLEAFTDTPRDNEALEEKLETIQVSHIMTQGDMVGLHHCVLG